LICSHSMRVLGSRVLLICASLFLYLGWCWWWNGLGRGALFFAPASCLLLWLAVKRTLDFRWGTALVVALGAAAACLAPSWVFLDPLYIQPGSPRRNGYGESFSSKSRDEFLNLEQCDTMLEARVLADGFKKHYNAARPHSALGYRPPAPEASALWPPGLRSANCAYGTNIMIGIAHEGGSTR
jgi:hypothetical protein